MGSDKAQITVTLFCVETGEVLEYQYIWTGKTKVCHSPPWVKPAGCSRTHTPSHWQSEATYLQIVIDVIVPYRLATIERLGRPANQKLLLKHDLHFSHKSDALLKFCEDNHIVLLPAQCTDALQECDIVLNSSFKASLRKSFRDWLHQSFNEHVASGKEPHLWIPKLTYGQLKPLFPGWIDTAVASLKTAETKQAIAKCFAEKGLFTKMRSEEQRRLAREKIAATTAHANTDNEVPLEIENDEDHAEDVIAEDDSLEVELAGDFTRGCTVAFDDDVSDDGSDFDASEDSASD